MSGRDMTFRGPYLRTGTWMGDVGHPEALLPAGMKLDEAQFNAPDAVKVVIAAAGAAAAAVSIPVDALPTPLSWDGSSTIIPNGTVLHFGTNKFAVVNDADIQPGDTSIAVLAIPTALVDNDTATYKGQLRKSLPSGYPVGRTIAERDLNTAYGPAESTDDEIFLLAYDVEDLKIVNDGVAYRPNHVVYENFLPGWSTDPIWTSGLKDAIRAKYLCQLAEA